MYSSRPGATIQESIRPKLQNAGIKDAIALNWIHEADSEFLNSNKGKAVAICQLKVPSAEELAASEWTDFPQTTKHHFLIDNVIRIQPPFSMKGDRNIITLTDSNEIRILKQVLQKADSLINIAVEESTLLLPGVDESLGIEEQKAEEVFTTGISISFHLWHYSLSA
jgi:hypothetical protein